MITDRIRIVSLALCLAATGACSKQSPASAATANPPAASRPSSEAAGPASQAVGQAAPPPSGAPGSPQVVTGTVLETMNAAGYTYVRIKTGSGELWAASMQFAVAVGDKVTVPLETPMQNFRSTSLNRVFPEIYFASQITRAGDPAAPALASAHGSTASTLSAASPATQVVEPIPPAAGGTPIADVWAKRTSLAGKSVTVRGKVVKYNFGILGSNWLHLQDGSGSAKDGSNDLTVTSDGTVKLGDIVTVTGKVSINRDFGAGYAYKVMLEQASIVRK